jgi:hypothetical protein
LSPWASYHSYRVQWYRSPREAPRRYTRVLVEYHRSASYKEPRMRCLTTRALSWRRVRNIRPKNLMDRGTNETPGSESKRGRHKLHLEPTYETNMSPPGPDLRLESPRACGTFIRQPVVEKIRVVRGPRGQMKKNSFHRELLTSLRLATSKWQGKTRG